MSTKTRFENEATGNSEMVYLCFPYWEYQPFRLDDLDNSECRSNFRVEKKDIPRLATALQIPRFFRCSQGTVCPEEDGLCLLLRRLSYPFRYHEIIHQFARPVPELCMIANKVLDWLYDTHGEKNSPSPPTFQADDFVCRTNYPMTSFLDLISVLSGDVCP